MKRALGAGFAALVAAACSLESAGQMPRDGGSTTDSGCLPSGACVAALPPGFAPIYLALGNALDCPGAVVPKWYSEHPVLAPGVCTCGCDVTTKPTCDMGSLHRDYGLLGDSSCSGSGFTVPASGCTARGSSLILGDWGKLNVFLPLGGACTAKAIVDDTKVLVDPVRTCAVETCAESVCAGSAPAGFQSCIIGPGGASCPAAFPDAHVVFDQASVECSACTCNVINPKCSEAKVDWFSDAACTSQVGTSAVTGSCTKEANGGIGPSHFRYSAKATADCVAVGPTTPTPTLLGEASICCKLP
ncbi:hypothetical protein BH09MYX1_BH09MYX1_34200 [soil metagenome]